VAAESQAFQLGETLDYIDLALFKCANLIKSFNGQAF
jgi:hypothetical protein